MKRYLSPAEIAAALGLSRSRAYRLLASLPRVKIGRSVRVAEADLEAFLRQNTIQPADAPEPPEDSPRSRPAWARPLKQRGRTR